MTALRVLHVAQPTTAGVARVVGDLVRDQVARDWDVVVASPADGHLPDDARAAGADWRAWAASRGPGPTVPAETVRLVRLVRDVRPDLVHLHSSKAGLAGRLALRGRLPTVFQPHAWSFLALEGRARPLAVRWERGAVRWTDALAVVSEDERRSGEAAGIAGPYVLLPNGVDVERRRPVPAGERSDARAALGLPPGPLVVCVGRLSRQKGQDVLFQAWPQVRAALPDAQLVLVGEGPDRGALERTAPVGTRLAGSTSDPDPWLRAADVVALPSRWEGMSLALLEAMAHGRSIVATDVAGSRDALSDGAGGVVDVEDVDALAGALVVRLRDPALADAEGSRARQRAEREHDVRTTTARAAELYLRLLDR